MYSQRLCMASLHILPQELGAAFDSEIQEKELKALPKSWHSAKKDYSKYLPAEILQEITKPLMVVLEPLMSGNTARILTRHFCHSNCSLNCYRRLPHERGRISILQASPILKENAERVFWMHNKVILCPNFNPKYPRDPNCDHPNPNKPVKLLLPPRYARRLGIANLEYRWSLTRTNPSFPFVRWDGMEYQRDRDVHHELKSVVNGKYLFKNLRTVHAFLKPDRWSMFFWGWRVEIETGGRVYDLDPTGAGFESQLEEALNARQECTLNNGDLCLGFTLKKKREEMEYEHQSAKEILDEDDIAAWSDEGTDDLEDIDDEIDEGEEDDMVS